MSKIWVIVIAVASVIIGAALGWICKPKCAEIIDYRVDTIVVRDTIRESYPVEKIKYVTKIEKEYLKAKGYIGRLGGLVSHSNHYDTNNNTLEDLTLRFPGKPETIDELSKDYSSGLHPSANMKQTFDHELAHWLHAKKAPLFYVLVGGIENAGKDLSGRVSGYAQMDIKEFVAEYVTGRMSGATYPKVVDEMYRQFNGPDLKFS